MNRLTALAASILIAASLPALGQQTPPAAAPAAAPAASPAAPKPSCGLKPEYPGNLASDNMKRAWQRDFVAYLECLKKFATDQQQIAQDHIAAANAAADEYNAGVKEYNETAQKASGK